MSCFFTHKKSSTDALGLINSAGFLLRKKVNCSKGKVVIIGVLDEMKVDEIMMSVFF